VWTIDHGLNQLYPVVQVFDSTGRLIDAEIESTSVNSVTVRLLTASTGSARIVASGYLHVQSVSSSAWVVPHALLLTGCSSLYSDDLLIANAQVPVSPVSTNISLTRSLTGAVRILPAIGNVVQAIASDTWSIVHNLGFRPIVQVYDNSGDEIEVDILHPSVNTTTIYFLTPVAGTARFN
jgi:hypothetical protein